MKFRAYSYAATCLTGSARRPILLVNNNPPVNRVIQANIDNMNVIYTLFTYRSIPVACERQADKQHAPKRYQCNPLINIINSISLATNIKYKPLTKALEFNKRSSCIFYIYCHCCPVKEKKVRPENQLVLV